MRFSLTTIAAAALIFSASAAPHGGHGKDSDSTDAEQQGGKEAGRGRYADGTFTASTFGSRGATGSALTTAPTALPTADVSTVSFELPVSAAKRFTAVPRADSKDSKSSDESDKSDSKDDSSDSSSSSDSSLDSSSDSSSDSSEDKETSSDDKKSSSDDSSSEDKETSSDSSSDSSDSSSDSSEDSSEDEETSSDDKKSSSDDSSSEDKETSSGSGDEESSSGSGSGEEESSSGSGSGEEESSSGSGSGEEESSSGSGEEESSSGSGSGEEESSSGSGSGAGSGDTETPSGSGSSGSSNSTAPATGSSGGKASSTFPTAAGESTLSAPMEVTDFDGGMVKFGRGASCSSGEGGDADAVFIVADGGSLSNVIIGADQIEGVHCAGACTITNVWWEAVCEDALSFKGDGAGTVSGGGAKGAQDKVIQHNGVGTITISGFYVEDFGKLYRSCGNCKTQGERHVILDGVIASGGSATLVGINSNLGDTATITNSCITNTDIICQEFEGTSPGNEPKKISSGISAACKYTEADISAC